MLLLNSLVAGCLIAFIPFNLLSGVSFARNILYTSALDEFSPGDFRRGLGELNRPQIVRNQVVPLLFTCDACFVQIGERR